MTEWWRGAVLYQIYPRSFRDANGDGVGDLKGITEKLDYVAALGVDGIWLSPFFKSPMKDFGYDVSDYRDVDPLFGTLADFDALLERAHALGLKIVIDQVYSHTSDQHPWFTESRSSRTNAKADWYVWADAKADGTPPNNWLGVFGGGAWEWEPRRKQYYLHNFLREQPDLNLHHPETQQAILNTAEFWLERGADGFRLDVANFYMHDRQLRDNPPGPAQDAVKPYDRQLHIYDRSRPENLAFIGRLRGLLDKYSGRMAVAEIASNQPFERMIEYTLAPGRLHTAYSFYLLGPRRSAAEIRQGVEASLGRGADAWPSWALSNHDVIRVASRWSATPNDDLNRLLLAMLFSLRGTIFLYQGEELGLPQADVPYERLQDPEGKTFWPEHKGRDGCRTPMPWRSDRVNAGFSNAEPWLPVDPQHVVRAVDAQENDPASPLCSARRFLAWRKTQPALKAGDIRFFSTDEPVLAFERSAEGQTVICAFNLGAEPQTVSVEGWGSLTSVQEFGSDADLGGRTLHLPGHRAFFAHKANA